MSWLLFGNPPENRNQFQIWRKIDCIRLWEVGLQCGIFLRNCPGSAGWEDKLMYCSWTGPKFGPQHLSGSLQTHVTAAPEGLQGQPHSHVQIHIHKHTQMYILVKGNLGCIYVMYHIELSFQSAFVPFLICTGIVPGCLWQLISQCLSCERRKIKLPYFDVCVYGLHMRQQEGVCNESLFNLMTWPRKKNSPPVAEMEVRGTDRTWPDHRSKRRLSVGGGSGCFLWTHPSANARFTLLFVLL